VSVESVRTAPGIDDARAVLGGQGYVLTKDVAIGLPEDFRSNFRQMYFNDEIIRHDEGDLPVDRQRARDVIRYEWRDDGLYLEEYDKITITDRADIPGPREHSRVMLLEDPQARALVVKLLSLVPPERRQAKGTVGINLFRTFTNVVTKPHRDNEDFVALYVLGRIGDGAETLLYNPGDVSPDGKPTADPVLRHQLDPGEIVIFDDERFMHDATALEPPLGGTAMRDVLVCTVDDKRTYPAAGED
jgi:hypothetical protein